MQVNIHEAKKDLSNLERLIETGKEDAVITSRYGKPFEKMAIYNVITATKRIGIAKGKLKSPKDLDYCNEEIAAMFAGKTGKI